MKKFYVLILAMLLSGKISLAAQQSQMSQADLAYWIKVAEQQIAAAQQPQQVPSQQTQAQSKAQQENIEKKIYKKMERDERSHGNER